MAVTDCFQIFGKSIGIRFPSKAIADTFRHVLGGFTCPPCSSHTCCFRIAVEPDRGTFSVVAEGRDPVVYGSLFGLVSGLERVLLDDVFGRLDGPGVHGGCVTRPGDTILIPGNPGAGHGEAAFVQELNRRIALQPLPDGLDDALLFFLAQSGHLTPDPYWT